MPPLRATLPRPATRVTTATVTVGAATTPILPADGGRRIARVTNAGAATVYLAATVPASVANGFPLAAGATMEYTATLALNGIVATGTEPVRVWDEGGG